MVRNKRTGYFSHLACTSFWAAQLRVVFRDQLFIATAGSKT